LLPEPTNRYSGATQPDFEDRLREIGADAAAGKALIIVFTDDVVWAPTVEEIQSLTGLPVREQNGEGVILAGS
jgi:hypothetical protein